MNIKILITGLIVSMSLGLHDIYSNNLVKTQTKEDKIKAILDAKNYAPDFTLKALNDSSYTLSELRGKVVLLNFWATWCGPCRMEIPDFNEIYKEYGSKDIEILSISISDTRKALENFIKVYPMDYPVLYGKQKELDKIMRDYGGVYAVPTSVLIGRKGDVLKTYPGALLRGHPIHTAFMNDLASALKQK